MTDSKNHTLITIAHSKNHKLGKLILPWTIGILQYDKYNAFVFIQSNLIRYYTRNSLCILVTLFILTGCSLSPVKCKNGYTYNALDAQNLAIKTHRSDVYYQLRNKHKPIFMFKITSCCKLETNTSPFSPILVKLNLLRDVPDQYHFTLSSESTLNLHSDSKKIIYLGDIYVTECGRVTDSFLAMFGDVR